MTVLVPSFEHEDCDFLKSLGLLDGCDPVPWSTSFLDDDLLNFDADLLLPESLPELPAGVTSMVSLDALHGQQFSPASSDSWHPTVEASSDNSSESAGTPTVASQAAAPARASKKDPRIGKRKPEPRLEAIADVQERRKQRRLAKNRATAAVSRERKRELMATLETRVEALEADNANLSNMLSARDAELAALRQRLSTSGTAW